MKMSSEDIKEEGLEMKKWLGSLIVMVAAISLLAGCAPEEKKEVKKENGKTVIRLGVMPSTDNIPFIIAQQKGYLKERGVSLDLEVFKSANDRDAALQAGKLDGVITDLVAVAIYQQGDLDVKVVAAPYDQFDLVSSDGEVQTVADLKGKDVVFATRSGTAYAIDKMLQEAGLTMADITVNEVPQVPARLELLTNQKASAAILPEPFVTMAKAGGMNVVQSTRDIGINPFAIAFTTSFIEGESEALRSMFDAYNQAADYVKTADKADYLELFIKEVGFPETLKDQIDVPDYGKLEQVKVADVESAFGWSTEAGLLKKDLKAEDVISDVYFK